MPYVRKLPSGKWAATVRLPDGSRPTETFDLKGQADAWANDLAADARRGDWIDPRAGDISIGEWQERCHNARTLEYASRKRDESHWRVHVKPRWQGVPIGSVLKVDVKTWINEMKEAGVGAATIHGAHGVLLALMELAVDARLRRDNPARRVGLPQRDAHFDRVLAPDEDELLMASLDRQFPRRPDARLFCELLEYSGLRYEEAAAIDRDHVDMRRQLINIGPVLERNGTIRAYPKSPAGVRPVPVDDDIWPRFRAHVLTIRPGALVFTGVRGGVMHYSSWHRRVWLPALHGPADGSPFAYLGVPEGHFGDWLSGQMAGRGFSLDRDLAAAAGINASLIANWRAGRFLPSGRNLELVADALGVPADDVTRAARGARELGAGLDDPQPTPHDLRHTYGTRLGEGGVPVHEIMALMGHETLESAKRYLHAGEDRFARARAAMRQGRKSAAGGS